MAASCAICLSAARGDDPRNELPADPAASNANPGITNLPQAGTPIGLPGPPHLPFGAPAGSRDPEQVARFINDLLSDRTTEWYGQRTEAAMQSYLQAKQSGKDAERIEQLYEGARTRIRQALRHEIIRQLHRIESARERLNKLDRQLQRRFESLDRLVDREFSNRSGEPPRVDAKQQGSLQRGDSAANLPEDFDWHRRLSAELGASIKQRSTREWKGFGPKREWPGPFPADASESMDELRRLRAKIGERLAESPATGSDETLDSINARTSSMAKPADLPPDQRAGNNLNLRWQFDASEAIESSPAVDKGRVFVADVDGQLLALDCSDGRQLWNREYKTGFTATPAIKADLLVIGDIEGNVYGVDTNTGKEIWKTSTDGEIGDSATFHNGQVLVPDRSGKLHCLATRDGSTIWTYELDDQLRCRPTVVGGRAFLGGCDGGLHIVDLDTGKAVGRPLALAGPTGSSPAVLGTQVFVPVKDGVVHCFDCGSGQELWQYRDEDQPQDYRSDPAVTDRLVIVASQTRQVDAISIETGKRVWRATLPGRPDASPVVVGDQVWIATTDGRLTRLSTTTGQPVHHAYEVRGSFVASPVIINGDVFIANDRGLVICLSSRPGVSWQGRHFVRLVIDSDEVTFQGKTCDYDQLSELLAAVPNRNNTVLEFAFASQDYPEEKKTEAINLCLQLSREYGFEYASYIGVKPKGSLGSPSQHRTNQEANARY